MQASRSSSSSSGPASGQQLAGKIALVTGGGSGVGKVTALTFAAQGAHVVLAGRRPTPLDEVAQECEALGVQALAVPTDLADPVAVKSLFAKCQEKFGRLDILFNNVAVQPEAPCHEHTLADWSRAISVNLTSYFLFCHHLLPGMLAKGAGSIVNLASVRAPRAG